MQRLGIFEPPTRLQSEVKCVSIATDRKLMDSIYLFAVYESFYLEIKAIRHFLSFH